jgi:hypothetical protein
VDNCPIFIELRSNERYYYLSRLVHLASLNGYLYSTQLICYLCLISTVVLDMLSSVIFFVKSLLQYLNRFSFLVCQKVIVLVIDVRSPNSKTHLNMTKKSYMPMPTFRKTERLLEIIKVCDFFFEKLKLSIKWYNIYKLYKFSFASYRTNFGWAHPFSKIKKMLFQSLENLK